MEDDGRRLVFELDDAMRYRCQQLAMMLPWVIKLTVAQVDYCVIHAEVPPEIDCLETFLTGLQSGDPVSTQSCLLGAGVTVPNTMGQ